MKLLFLTEFFPADNRLVFTGGVEARTYSIVRYAKKDYQVKVIASSSKQIPATPFSIITRIGFLFTSFFKCLFTQFDLIEASNVVTYLPAFLAAKLKGKPVVIWVPDILGKNWFDFGFLVGITGFLMEKMYLLLPWDGVIALSASTEKKLKSAHINTKHLTIVHGGINPEEFHNLGSIKKLPIFTVCCIARLVKTKRLHILINAFKLLAETHKIRLIIIGRGPQKNLLLFLIHKFKLREKISLIDYLSRTKLIHTLAQSHLLCLPSVVEGFGLVTIEAMAAGLPVVLANISINHEVSQDQGVLFFKPDNEVDLAAQIEKLLINTKLYQQKKSQAIRLASNYSWLNVYHQTKKIYALCTHR